MNMLSLLRKEEREADKSVWPPVCLCALAGEVSRCVAVRLRASRRRPCEHTALKAACLVGLAVSRQHPIQPRLALLQVIG